jgi:diguanylate cyclase (GGDEF)-like protein
MYALLAINAAAVAYTHMGLAPQLLTQIIPGILILVCAVRFYQWVAPLDMRKVDQPFAERMLKRTTVMSLVLSIGFLLWALTLDQYGGLIEHGHIAVFVAITVLGCIFCLSYLPNAARIVCYIVLGGFLIYCLAQRQTVLIAIAINILLVGILVLKVNRDSFAAFVNLERSRHELQAERFQAELLGEENARLAQSDMLTQLPNRRFFFAKLEQLLSRSGPDDAFCIGLIDLDRFKPVNDNLGHAQGDRLLQAIGHALASLSDASTRIARLGGDEFGVILQGSAADAERRIQQISDRIEPLRVARHQQPVAIGHVIHGV